MNQKTEKYGSRIKGKYYESEVSSEDEDEESHTEKGVLTKTKRKSRQRQENSLGELTKNFINYIKEQGGREININDVVKQLKVKKRRIYDITNVLEGIGYIKKLAKNKIQWLKNDPSLSDDDDEEMENNDNITYQEPDERELIEKEMNELNMEENHLDEWITSIKNSFEKLTEDRSFKEYGYVTFDDIKALTVGEDINLIAIKAPAGTSLEIPDPDQIQNIYMQTLQNMKNGIDEFDQSLLDSLEKKYQLFLDSPNGEINVFLVLNKMEDEKSEISSKNMNNLNMNMGMNMGMGMGYSKSSPLSNNILQTNRSYKNLQSKGYDNSLSSHSQDMINGNMI